MQEIPYGYCHCGCGQKTGVAPWTVTEKGWTKGEPKRFIHNHHGRVRIRYIVEDRGYKTPCWIWQLSLDKDGYGYVKVGGRNGQSYRAHRYYYEQAKGPIPKGLDPDHLCRVRCCVNPDHLEPVTPAVNTRRGLNPKLTEAQVIAMRQLRASTCLSYAKIAAQFSVTTMAAYYICKGINWKL